jgi:hypothetical protein
VDWNVDACLALEGIERGADLRNRLIRTVERRAENGDDADGVLVAQLDRFSADTWKRSPSMGTRRISTSQ